jgi:hypothetical protein
MTLTITNEAIAAVAQRAQSMGFAINNIMAASMLEAGFKAQFGPDVNFADADVQLAQIARQVEAQGAHLATIGKFLSEHAPYIMALSNPVVEEAPGEGDSG